MSLLKGRTLETKFDEYNNPPEDKAFEDKRISDVREKIDAIHGSKLTRKKFEDTHTRNTFMLENSLHKRLTERMRAEGKGWKTTFLNQAVQELLDDYDKR